MCKIIPFPQPNTLSDEDLFNLLMGVMRMIERHATPEQVGRLLARLTRAEHTSREN